jgi:flagellar biosynthesis protein FlhA
MEVELGFGLVPLVDRSQGGALLDRIATVRQQLAEELGFILPPVNVHDNVRLRNVDYALRIRGLEVAHGTLQIGNLLAIDSGGGTRFDGGVEVVGVGDDLDVLDDGDVGGHGDVGDGGQFGQPRFELHR